MAPARPDNRGEEKKRGRPSNASKATAARSTRNQARGRQSAAMKQRGRLQKSTQHTKQDVPRRKAARIPNSSKGRKRKADDVEDEIAEAEPETQPYARLAPKRARISQESMAKWPAISQLILRQMGEVLNIARREVVNTRRDTQRRDEADQFLGKLIKNLERSLMESKVPPNAKDVHFNVDKLEELNDTMNREATAGRHSAQLLEERVNEAKRALRLEERSLEDLKKKHQKWRAEWKHRGTKQKLHPLLTRPVETSPSEDMPEDIGLKESAASDTSWLDVSESDPDIGDMLEQLRRSLETMQSNHAQVEGIDEAMRGAQAALDDVLYRRASAQQYDAL
ncbi:hypothetical protein CC78DRAFT_537659 [Lojkania enalia]|uniref:Kinetochore protein fta7 n=1 Tax=Lojkania enalia TaxID=147567 RepID=A0A9P4JY20_9PLEO|nr:hypothetical protein CC78DRAFT_537659 [Didymosphaeria enalia]